MSSASIKEPWQHFPDIWPTQSAFFAYLRGQIRQIWSHYPAKLKWKETQVSDPPPGYTGRAKKLGKCYYCNELFAKSHLEVDHVVQAGSCNSWQTAQEFMYKLLDCNDNWVLACKPCHKVKSHAEKTGLSFEDALAEKRAIAFEKKGTEEVVAFCKKHGYNTSELSNGPKRRQALVAIFKEQK